MRVLLLKELRQGRSLLVFAAAAGLLLAAGGWVFGRTLYYRFNANQLNEAVSGFIYATALSFAWFAGAGLFAEETDRGTLPGLLALPLSRRRIWLAKLLAGLVLLALCVGLLLGLDALLVPKAMVFLKLQTYGWDMLCWLAFVFAVSVFASTLVASTTGALGLTLVLAGALSGGAAYLVYGLGGPLLGFDEELDWALWCLAHVPTLLIASARLLRRGELLHARRRWWLGLRVFAVGAVVTVLFITAVARYATRYQRDRVVQTRVMWLWETGGPTAALALEAFASPISRERSPSRGWIPREKGEYGLSSPDFRRDYEVILDLTTGREAAHWRSDMGESYHTAWSRDGRRAAALATADGLTWRKRVLSLHSVLRLVDIPGRRVTDTTGLEALGGFKELVHRLSWSPDGRYLAVGVQMKSGGDVVQLLDDRGRAVQALPWTDLRTWQWSSAEDIIYATDAQGRLLRLTMGGNAQVIWQRSPQSKDTLFAVDQVSPDGRWVLVEEAVYPDETRREGPSRAALYVVPAEGGTASQVGAVSGENDSHVSGGWTGDSRALYVVTYRGERDVNEMTRWTPGRARPEAIPLPPFGPRTGVRAFSRPGTDQVVLWAVPLRTGRRASLPRGPGHLFLLNSQGKVVKESPASRFTADHYLAAFDPKGRAIFGPRRGRDVLAVDLDTGKAERIYP